MLTIFSIPKAFNGPIGTIQRNAIKSWTLLRPECEVILMGDDEGTGEAAADLGVKNIPGVNRNEFGTPLLDHAYQLAQDEATNPLLCYVNADIILMRDFLESVETVRKKTDWFLMTARRWNLDVEEKLDFGVGWEDRLMGEVSNKGELGHHAEIDFWVYPKGLLSGIPPLAVGRMAFECWCLYKTREMKADLIDATGKVISVHQNHDYSHHPEGRFGIGTSIEAQRNRELVGGKSYFFTVRDRTHVLTPRGMRRSRDGWWAWRSLRAAPVLGGSRPLLPRLASRSLNGFIDLIRDTSIRLRDGIVSRRSA